MFYFEDDIDSDDDGIADIEDDDDDNDGIEDSGEFQFFNLPLWANFYNYTDLSCTTTSTTTNLDQPTLLYDLNPQPG